MQIADLPPAMNSSFISPSVALAFCLVICPGLMAFEPAGAMEAKVNITVPATLPTSPSLYNVRKVVIDAGHGGADHGCSGKSSKEKAIALQIALKVGAYIEQNLPDVEVIYTRKTDVFVELHERAAIANRANADVFISIHCNANANTAPYGTETYVMGLHSNVANLDVAKRENEVITLEDDYNQHYDGFDPNSPNAHIIFSLFQGAHLEQSIELAGRVEEQFAERVGRKSRGVKQAGFLVLYKTTMPAVLIETGFLTNANEEKFLASENGMDLIASAIFRAFRDYKVHTEERANLSNQSTAKVEAATETGPSSSSRPIPNQTPVQTPEPLKPAPVATQAPEKPTQVATSTSAKPTPEPTSTSAKTETSGAEPGSTSTTASVSASPETSTHDQAVSTETVKPVVSPSASPTAKPAEESKPVARQKIPDQIPEAATTVYRVQIYASQRKLAPTDPLFKSIQGEKIIRTQHGALFKYAVGNFTNPDEATAKKAQLRTAGYPDAFVITVEVANLAEN